ncbi:MAG: hypothetical protein HPY78_08295 [Brevinematales bacterium]|nr:hypothetical protein [Brevinematales bacterium]
MEAIVFSPLSEPQEVARKPGVRQGGLSPGGYGRERGYRLFFQPARGMKVVGYRNRRRGGAGVSKGAEPLLPRAGALRKRKKMGNKKSLKLKEKRWLNKYSVFV